MIISNDRSWRRPVTRYRWRGFLLGYTRREYNVGKRQPSRTRMSTARLESILGYKKPRHVGRLIRRLKREGEWYE